MAVAHIITLLTTGIVVGFVGGMLGVGGGFIMTTSVMELEGCDLELIQAWVDATKEFGVY